MTDNIAWSLDFYLRSLNSDGTQSKIFTPLAGTGRIVGPHQVSEVEDLYPRVNRSDDSSIRGGKVVLPVEFTPDGYGYVPGDAGYDSLETVLADWIAGKAIQVACHRKAGTAGTGGVNSFTVADDTFKASNGEVGNTLRVGTTEYIVTANTTKVLTIVGTPATGPGAWSLHSWKNVRISDKDLENIDGYNSSIHWTLEFTGKEIQSALYAQDDGSRW